MIKNPYKDNISNFLTDSLLLDTYEQWYEIFTKAKLPGHKHKSLLRGEPVDMVTRDDGNSQTIGKKKRTPHKKDLLLRSSVQRVCADYLYSKLVTK